MIKFFKKLQVKLRYLKKRKIKYPKTNTGDIESKIVYCNDFISLSKLDTTSNLSNIIIEFAFNKDSSNYIDAFDLMSSLTLNHSNMKVIFKSLNDKSYILISGKISEYVDLLYIYYKNIGNQNKIIELIIPLLYTLPLAEYLPYTDKWFDLLDKNKFTVDVINYKSKIYRDLESLDLYTLDFINFDNPKYFKYIDDNEFSIIESLQLSNIIYQSSYGSVVEENSINLINRDDDTEYTELINIMSLTDYFIINDNKSLLDIVQNDTSKYEVNNFELYADIDEIVE